MEAYNYLAKAQPCGCEVVAEEDKDPFDVVRDFLGTGLRCGCGNDYLAIEKVQPGYEIKGPKGIVDC